MSELEKSLTDIGWLNQKLNSSKHPRKETELNSENKLDDLERKSETLTNLPLPQKPVLSYANLIILAIRSASDNMLTLREIYNWVTDTYPYFRYTGNGWKNSIRHNLSLNKCFLKVSRPKDDKGKGCYWTFDKSHLDEDGYLKSKSRTRAMNQDRGSPYNQSHSPNPAFNLTPLFLKTSYKLQSSSEEEIASLEPKQFLLSFPNNQRSVLDQSDLLNQEIEPHIKDHKGQFYCIRYHPAISETNPSFSNNCEVIDKNSQISNDCSITEDKPIEDSMQGSTNLSNSFKKLFTSIFENIDNEMLSSDSIRNYESLKKSIKLAGFTNWNEINLSGFPDLAEIIKDADTNRWSLNHDQVLDLAASLTKFYSSISDIETQSNIINPLKDPFFSKDSTYHKDNFDVNSLLSCTDQTMPYPGDDCAQIIDGNDEIEDDFNWESLLLI